MMSRDKTCLVCGGPVSGKYSQHSDKSDCIRHLLKKNRELTIALTNSVSLQAHYARLLNGYDGGQRIIFENAEQWIERLKETHVIEVKP